MNQRERYVRDTEAWTTVVCHVCKWVFSVMGTREPGKPFVCESCREDAK